MGDGIAPWESPAGEPASGGVFPFSLGRKAIAVLAKVAVPRREIITLLLAFLPAPPVAVGHCPVPGHRGYLSKPFVCKLQLRKVAKIHSIICVEIGRQVKMVLPPPARNDCKISKINRPVSVEINSIGIAYAVDTQCGAFCTSVNRFVSAAIRASPSPCQVAPNPANPQSCLG